MRPRALPRGLPSAQSWLLLAPPSPAAPLRPPASPPTTQARPAHTPPGWQLRGTQLAQMGSQTNQDLRELERRLDHLRPSTTATTTMSLDELHSACHAAFTALSAQRVREPLKPHHQITLLVARTIRTLLEQRHWLAAVELDRAFFSTLPPPPSPPQGARGMYKSRPFPGDGLGMKRGKVQKAWMAAILLLPPDSGGREFAELVGEMLRQNQALELLPWMTAFLVRKTEAVAALDEANSEETGARERVKEHLAALPSTSEEKKHETLRLAAAELELERIERRWSRSTFHTTQTRLSNLEVAVRDLFSPSSTLTSSDASSTDPLEPPNQDGNLEDNLQTLHIALRFLLLRALHMQPYSAPNAALDVKSALGVYGTLLSLSLLSERARQRQRSSFIRLLATVRKLHTPSQAVPLVVEIVGATLSTTDRPLGLTKPWVHAWLQNLVNPARQQAGDPIEWETVVAFLDLVVRCAAHDKAVSSTIAEAESVGHAHKALHSHSTLLHLLRAALISTHLTASSTPLRQILTFLDEMVALQEWKRTETGKVSGMVEELLSHGSLGDQGESGVRWRSEVWAVINEWSHGDMDRQPLSLVTPCPTPITHEVGEDFFTSRSVSNARATKHNESANPSTPSVEEEEEQPDLSYI